MDLTSTPFVLGAVALALCCVGAVPWTWDRWSGRASRGLRTTLVLLSTVAVLAAMFVVVNRQAGFYPTAASLLPGHGPRLVPGRDGVVQVVDRTTAGLELAGPHRPGHGVVVGVTLPGARSGITRRAAVYLPAQYLVPGDTERFPVLELLSGSPGSPAQLLHLLHLAEVLDDGIARHQLSPLVVVVPDTNGSTLRDRECVNASGGVQDDTYLTVDLQDWARRQLRVDPPGRGWGLLGMSTGGYCAVNLALRHPDRYTAAASLSGYFHALTDVTTGDLFRGASTRRANDPTDQVRAATHLSTALFLSAGTGESRELRELTRFAAALPTGTDVTTVVVPGAGHVFASWRAVLPQALAWSSGHLTPAGAPAPTLPGQQLRGPGG